MCIRDRAGILLELGLEPLEQGEGVGGGAGEAADHVALAEAAHLAGIGLDDGLADRDLTVAADDHAAALADGQDGGAVPQVGRGGLQGRGLHGAEDLSIIRWRCNRALDRTLNRPLGQEWRSAPAPDTRRHAGPKDHFHAQGRGQAHHEGDRCRGRGRPRRHRRVRDCDRDRLPRPYARPPGAPFPHRHHRQGQRRPAHRPPPHHRGRRDRARPGGEAGARRHERRHPLCRCPYAHGRGADPGRHRYFRPAVSGVQGRLRARQDRHLRHRAGAGVVPGLRHEQRRHAARGDTLWHQRPSYRRILLQRIGAGPAHGSRDRRARAQRGSVDEGFTRRVTRACPGKVGTGFPKNGHAQMSSYCSEPEGPQQTHAPYARIWKASAPWLSTPCTSRP